MPVEKLFAACLTGTVQQGCIGVGEYVYINGDYSKPFRLYHFDDPATTHASAGDYARLFLVPNRRDLLRQARIITGMVNPPENAYRFCGSVAEYFASVLQRHFAEYTLQTSVEYPGLEIPVSYMLLKNGQPAAAIFVIDSQDSHARCQLKKASAIFGNRYTYFYGDYRNELSYVVNRIRAVID